MSPLAGEVTKRHLRNGWEHLGERPGDGRYHLVRKVFRENDERTGYLQMEKTFKFTPADFVFRKGESEDVDTVFVYNWNPEKPKDEQPTPWKEPKGMVHLPYTLLDTFTYTTN
jgi:hypothetical protein